MDSPEKLPTVLSLCTGYGGLELGLEGAVGACRPLAYVEIDAFACGNLVAKIEEERMAPAPIWTDLKTLPTQPFRGRVDFLLGGYPCQPFSHAGRRGGADDPRHLWPHIARLVREIRPSFCFFENVEGHLSLGLSTVKSDLEEIGYDVAIGLFSAREVGAPHKRTRVYVLAYSDNRGRFHGQAQELTAEAGLDAQRELGTGGSNVADSKRIEAHRKRGTGKFGRNAVGRKEKAALEKNRAADPIGIVGHRANVSYATLHNGKRCRPEKSKEGYEPSNENRWAIEPGLGRVAHGVKHRVDRLRLLGNGVVRQTATKAFKTLLKDLQERLK